MANLIAPTSRGQSGIDNVDDKRVFFPFLFLTVRMVLVAFELETDLLERRLFELK